MDGLGQKREPEALRPRRLQQPGGVVVAGDEEDAASGVQRHYVLRELNAVHGSHHDVGDEDVRSHGGGFRDRLFGGVRGLRRVALHLEDGGESVGDELLVVNDKDAG